MDSVKIRILYLEDSPEDFELTEIYLESYGLSCEVQQAKGATEFLAALDGEEPDLILSDFSLPDINGLTALKLVRGKWPATPFILLSGVLGEARAIESLKSGATDYVLKGQLTKLGPSVERALREKEELLARRVLETSLQQSQKVEGIGRLAGGIAHDFNNKLAVIMLCGSSAASQLPDGHPVQKALAQIMKAAEDSAALTYQLLAFSRKQVLKPVVFNLNDSIRESKILLDRIIGEDVRLTDELSSDLYTIKADPTQIDQIIMNLCVNSRDAMPEGGVLTMKTENLQLSLPGEGVDPTCVKIRYVKLTVSDTGTGMDQDTLSQIFEPFFTTKELGKGTGLGLATVHGIVSQSGGHIEVKSSPGMGTSFEIYLPASEESMDQPASEYLAQVAEISPQSILVVEDEELLRKVIVSFLKDKGHSVHSAASGDRALEILESLGKLDLLITDMILPGINGIQLAKRVGALMPEAKVIYMSGHFENPNLITEVQERGATFIEKPISAASLNQALAKAVGD